MFLPPQSPLSLKCGIFWTAPLVSYLFLLVILLYALGDFPSFIPPWNYLHSASKSFFPPKSSFRFLHFRLLQHHVLISWMHSPLSLWIFIIVYGDEVFFCLNSLCLPRYVFICSSDCWRLS